MEECTYTPVFLQLIEIERGVRLSVSGMQKLDQHEEI